MIGANTIGNATFIAYDKKPIITTDPWLNDDEAYYGSWTLNFHIPDNIVSDIFQSEFYWFSHGHPDHLNPHSIKKFLGKKILLPDHVGLRIYKWLKNIGYNVKILTDRKWYKLSQNIKVMSISDYNQDAILLIKIKDHLFINTNDAVIRSCRKFIKKISQQFSKSYLLSLSGYGDADMINIFDENGNRVLPAAAMKFPVGKILSDRAKSLSAKSVIPFSSFHQYARTDSIWAEEFTTPVSAYSEGFDHNTLNYIKPFATIDCEKNVITNFNLKENKIQLFKPEDFGDSWSEELSKDDFDIIKKYFFKMDLLKKKIGFLTFKVGGKENSFYLNKNIKKGITFSAPRKSLIRATKYEVFDDLLIGNFMKTTFHGIKSLYDIDFNPIVTKYADNGRVFTEDQYKKYRATYRERSEGEWLREYFEHLTSQIFRKYVHYESRLYNYGRIVFNTYKKMF